MEMALDRMDESVRDIVAVLPARTGDLARLQVMARWAHVPTVTVIGKYNHGKSRLLNELMGSDVFSVADRRETMALAEHLQGEVRWLDAPGLDADVSRTDDRHADKAVWREADVRLFVHSAKEGELDAAEAALWQELHADQQRTHRQTLFVLTQVDQMPDDEHLQRVTHAISAQTPATCWHRVSATRHRQGVEQGKQLLVEKSGVPALQEALRDAVAHVPLSRMHERAMLLGEMSVELGDLRAATQRQQQEWLQLQQRQREDFDHGLLAVLMKVSEDLQPILEVSGKDESLVPDSFENMFKLTAGKRERAHIQIAYSRACIAINAHLVKHGVVGLPLVQQTSVRSLDTVMVAVMGVSVKYRDDLRRMFCESRGQEHLRREFARYFELSEERVQLGQALELAQALLHRIDRAQAALRLWEAP
ncbi:GTPase [Diaphorobacter sp.]|uniref:GTPase n=1 Tax=Diaphorobacter sp. TaxID=1934310 RepID=UPI0028A61CB6|nr:GTPase [Diaphorobacter sp.]